MDDEKKKESPIYLLLLSIFSPYVFEYVYYIALVFFHLIQLTLEEEEIIKIYFIV